MQLYRHTQLGAFFESRAHPVQRAVGPVGMHIGLHLNHLEAMLLDIALYGFDAVLDAAARVVDKAANEAVGMLLHAFECVSHVIVDGLAARLLTVAPCVDGVALGRLNEGLVDTAGFAIDVVGAIHGFEQPVHGIGFAVVPPSQVNLVGGVAADVDDHVSLLL